VAQLNALRNARAGKRREKQARQREVRRPTSYPVTLLP